MIIRSPKRFFFDDCLLYRFTDLTGTDYSEGAVELSRAIAGRNNVDNVTFLVSFSMHRLCLGSHL